MVEERTTFRISIRLLYALAMLRGLELAEL